MPRKKQHQWIADRNMIQPALVLRIDDYSLEPLSRGQFVAVRQRTDDNNNKAIWPSVEHAKDAAEWAVKKFGHQYAVFQMVEIVEHEEPPIRHTEVE